MLVLILFIPTDKSNATVPSSQINPELGHIVEIKDTRLYLSSGAVLNLYGIEFPLLHDKQESAKRSSYLHSKLKNSLVRLEDESFVAIGLRRNRYGDYLGNIHIGNIWLQKYLLEKGWARLNGVYPYPVEDLVYLRKIESRAREHKRGIWRQKGYGVKQADSNIKADYRFHLVEGWPQNVVTVGRNTYINFGTDWHRDFTVAIANNRRRHFKTLKVSLKDLIGKKIRVRGWIRPYNGPFMELESWTQIELLDCG